jgi:hypothetical protein
MSRTYKHDFELTYANKDGDIRVEHVDNEDVLDDLTSILDRNGANYIVNDVRPGYAAIPVYTGEWDNE